MNNPGSNIKDCKRRAEWAELRFMAAAAAHGLRIAKPWGDSSRYDLVVEGNNRLFRIQIKSTICRTKRGYIAHAQNGGGAYPPNALDFFAIYIAPEDIWYIIPYQRVNPSGHVRVKTTAGPGLCQYSDYKEAWHLLGAEPDSTEDQPDRPAPSIANPMPLQSSALNDGAHPAK